MTPKLYYTFENTIHDLQTITRAMTLAEWSPDLIIGPCRGAYIPGVMLSHYYDRPFGGFQWSTRDHAALDRETLEKLLVPGKNILIVDDINDSGATLKGIHEVVVAKLGGDATVKYACLFNKTKSEFTKVDFFAKEMTPEEDIWVVFPYEEWWGFRAHGALNSP